MAYITTDEERVAACLHAMIVLAQRRAVPLTRTKSQMLLYLADLCAVREHGTAGSGVAWRNGRKAPFCRSFAKIENALAVRGAAKRLTRRATATSSDRWLYASPATPSDLIEKCDAFVSCLNAVLDAHGTTSEGDLTRLAACTPPVLEARQSYRRGALLDLGEHADADPDADIAAGRVTRFESGEDFIAALKAV